ncbi:L,D-transpeptidase family protein [Mangrovihabitans endophyticus]|uniref:Peptidoglycan-binding protein n=1 Tax=Mangrovihabitans endophyticus TaxID=1751298 RepID=A0A8J3BW53_9ACTN|nr:L,D-transpeptidase family protein [Mangrovihabitans endophyticus]GGK74414.1 peptidoglycan-binding protein [Mangrovihabitans endophyticus]
MSRRRRSSALPSTRRLTLLLSLLTAMTMMATSAVVAVTSAAARANPVGYAAADRPSVRYGSRGATVRYLQQRLAALRYDVGGVDGVFGTDTLHAVYAFQKVQRIGVDGIVGRTTWTKLASPYRPGARHRHSAAAVEISLSRRVVFLTRRGAVTRIVDASPGKASTRTPTGNFTIGRRINGWRQSHLGLLWRPYYFYGGYAVHGSNSVPTYAASHGCVRVTVPAMNRLWSQLFIGERVHVYR